MIFNIIFLLVGLGGGYFIYDILLRRNKGLHRLMNAVKKSKPIAMLETDKSVYFRPIEKTVKNIGITSNRELIIIPKASMKPCVNLKGTPIAHGDLYKAVTVPQEMRKFIDERKNNGWSQEDIGNFLKDIEEHDEDGLIEKWSLKENPGDPNPEGVEKFKVFKNLSSVVKDFIYTGVNRVNIHDMVRELTYQRDLEDIGKTDWVKIAVAIVLVLIGIGIAWRFIFSSPGMSQVLGGMAGGASRITP